MSISGVSRIRADVQSLDHTSEQQQLQQQQQQQEQQQQPQEGLQGQGEASSQQQHQQHRAAEAMAASVTGTAAPQAAFRTFGEAAAAAAAAQQHGGLQGDATAQALSGLSLFGGGEGEQGPQGDCFVLCLVTLESS